MTNSEVTEYQEVEEKLDKLDKLDVLPKPDDVPQSVVIQSKTADELDSQVEEIEKLSDSSNLSNSSNESQTPDAVGDARLENESNTVSNLSETVVESSSIAIAPATIAPSPVVEKPNRDDEDLNSGSAVGRLAHTRNSQGKISPEAWQITKWCDCNGFYTLENGDTAYPFELFLD